MNDQEIIQHLLQALEAIEARVDGEWDHPALKGYLVSHSAIDDCSDIARSALEKASYNQYTYKP